MIFLGNDKNNSNIYRCYDKENNKIVISRDVTFQKSLESNLHETEIIFKNKNQQESSDVEIETEADSPIQQESSEVEIEAEADSPIQRISSRVNKGVPPDRYGYDQTSEVKTHKDDIINMLLACSTTEPKNISEVNNSENKNEWTQAIQEEIDSLKKMKHGKSVNYQKIEKLLVANGFIK